MPRQWEHFCGICPSPRQQMHCGWLPITRKATLQEMYLLNLEYLGIRVKEKLPNWEGWKVGKRKPKHEITEGKIKTKDKTKKIKIEERRR